MAFADSYIKKNQFTKLEFTKVPIPSGLLRYIVVIPAYSEPGIFHTLKSLKECNPPRYMVEVYILINYSESVSNEIKQQNKELFDKLKDWCAQNYLSWLTFHPFIIPNLPKKHAGVGLARKILMDSAVERFSEVDMPNGFILSLDADTIVPGNYFTDLEHEASENKETGCYIFNFEHPIKGSQYNKNVYHAALLYELHLRYYKLILKSTGYPFYHYTIGSCFAISANTYVKVGGMSKRKAGEDFYFLQKVFAVSNVSFLNKVVLIPSSRPSWRVPFGTGPAIRKMLNTNTPEYLTYHPELFEGITQLLKTAPLFYKSDSIEIKEMISVLPGPVFNFLGKNKIYERINEVKQNSASKESFIKRFLNWFDAFMVLKYLNYASEKFLPTISVTTAICIFLKTDTPVLNYTPENLLVLLRKKEME